MTSFGWKRKLGANVSRSTVSSFEADAADEEEDEAIASGEVDWLTLAKRPKVSCLEDGVSKAKRLREEGSVLSTEDRCWEAIRKWDEALTYTPSDETIFEMKAQAYMQLNEVYPALQAATKAVFVNPRWWIAHQTLGRALMGLGEVQKAIKSYSRAIFINPAEKELWEEDLSWAVSLMKRKREATALLEEQLKQKASNVSIIDLDEEEEKPASHSKDGTVSSSAVTGYELSRNLSATRTSETKLPSNYVCMRE